MAITPFDDALQLALQYFLSGQFPAAEAIYQQILSQDPFNVDALHLLGVIAGQTGRLAGTSGAIDLLRRAIGLRPNEARIHCNLAKFLADQNLLEESCAASLRALQLDPKSAPAYANLGWARFLQKRFPDSIAAYRQAVRLRWNDTQSHLALANSLMSNRNFAEAASSYRQVLRLQPALPDAHNNLGLALEMCGRHDEAISAFRDALQLNPQHFPALKNLGNALRDTGQLDGALDAYRAAVALQPPQFDVHSNLIFIRHFHAGSTMPQIRDDLRAWSRRHAEPLEKLITPHANDRSPDRPLRIGYVSPNLLEQAECYFVVPLLETHDRRQFQIHAYSDVRRPDAITQRLRNTADHWRETPTLSDDQLAAQIRADGIDILIDLTMHMANHRLLTFARKPAPLQLTWLAYPGSTGLNTIDYRLTDAFMDPPSGETDPFYSEKSIRLPDCWVCYAPVLDTPPVNDLPALTAGHITFGSLNTFCKINDVVLDLWSKVLRAVPNCQLLLLAPPGDARQRVRSFLQIRGIKPERLQFAPSQSRLEYHRLYHRIDIALDPFPYNGITTTCDALWMGVPVLTRPHANPAARAGLALLSTAGLNECISTTDESFIENARQLAGDLPRLGALRSSLRDKFRASPVMDAPRFARHVEAAYRQIWQSWCARQP